MQLTFQQYKKILVRAEAKQQEATSIDERHRWFMVCARILIAMTNPVIFYR